MLHRLSRTVALGLLALLPALGWAEEVNIYSSRQEELIRPILERFSKRTGIQVNVVTGKDDALIERLRIEGKNSPADLLLTADAGRLWRAKSMDLLQPIQSKRLNAAVPSHLRDPDGEWYGLSMRARPIMYVQGKVDPSELSTYQNLADPRWDGRICIRSSGNIYNQSLVAAQIAHHGVEQTEAWARGLVSNFARPPAGGDRDQIKAAAAGMCDIAIANTYYLGGMLTSPDQSERAAAQKMAVFWPNQKTTGTHVNISGGGVTKAARNPENARRLLEFLVSDQAQQWYAESNAEYPVKEGVDLSPVLAEWGTFKADDLPMAKLGENNAEAVRLMDRAGWK